MKTNWSSFFWRVHFYDALMIACVCVCVFNELCYVFLFLNIVCFFMCLNVLFCHDVHQSTKIITYSFQQLIK